MEAVIWMVMEHVYLFIGDWCQRQQYEFWPALIYTLCILSKTAKPILQGTGEWHAPCRCYKQQQQWLLLSHRGTSSQPQKGKFSEKTVYCDNNHYDN